MSDKFNQNTSGPVYLSITKPHSSINKFPSKIIAGDINVKDLTLEESEFFVSEKELDEIKNIGYSDEKLLSIIDEPKLKISAKIKSNLIFPPNIDDNISAIFEVEVSPTGDVLKVVLKEPSGNVYFDQAIESAIYVSSPLPITDNYEIYKRHFQKFDLYFSPRE